MLRFRKGGFVQLILLCFLFTYAAFGQESKLYHQNTPPVWGPLKDGWQVALFSEKNGFYTDEPVEIRLDARNGSSRSLRVHLGKYAWEKAAFEIRRVGDQQILRPKPTPDMGGGPVKSVEPGKTVSFGVVNLLSLYDLPPGTYTITATCKLEHENRLVQPELKADAKVTSNQITISIIRR